MGQFQVALGGQRQVDQAVVALHVQGVQVRHGAALGVLGIVKQSGGRGMCLRQVLRLPGMQIGALQLFAQLAQAQGAVEYKAGAFGNDEALQRAMLLPLHQLRLLCGRCFSAVEHFGGLDAVDPVGDIFWRALRQRHAGLRQAHPGQTHGAAAAALGPVQRQQHGFVFVTQQGRVGQGAGGYHAHHLALHRPFAGAHFAYLFANGDRFAHLNQFGQVVFDRMYGHAGHDHGLAGRLTALCQRNAEQPCGFDGIVVKKLVKIPHAVKQQGVRVLRLDLQVLLHHGRVGIRCFVNGSHGVNLPQAC